MSEDRADENISALDSSEMLCYVKKCFVMILFTSIKIEKRKIEKKCPLQVLFAENDIHKTPARWFTENILMKVRIFTPLLIRALEIF